MDRLNWLLIINGKSACDDALRQAVLDWRGRGVDIGVRVTWEAGDGARYAHEAIEAGVDTVIAAGGDGSLNEIAGALASSEAVADALPSLALVPLGTANDFATATALPEAPGDALALVHATRAVPLDLLRVHAEHDLRWCINLASGGFGTDITTQANEGLKKVLGGLAYVITGLGRLGSIEPVPARITGPGFEWEGSFIALAIGNGRQAGGGMELCPDALLDDGLVELTVVPDLGRQLASTARTVLGEGRQAALQQAATRARLPWLEIRTAEALTLNLDGEPIVSRRYRVECVPGRLRMHLPPGCMLLSRVATAGVVGSVVAADAG